MFQRVVLSNAFVFPKNKKTRQRIHLLSFPTMPSMLTFMAYPLLYPLSRNSHPKIPVFRKMRKPKWKFLTTPMVHINYMMLPINKAQNDDNRFTGEWATVGNTLCARKPNLALCTPKSQNKLSPLRSARFARSAPLREWIRMNFAHNRTVLCHPLTQSNVVHIIR